MPKSLTEVFGKENIEFGIKDDEDSPEYDRIYLFYADIDNFSIDCYIELGFVQNIQFLYYDLYNNKTYEQDHGMYRYYIDNDIIGIKLRDYMMREFTKYINTSSKEKITLTYTNITSFLNNLIKNAFKTLKIDYENV